MDVSLFVWAGVLAFILVALAVDLFVFHRDAHEVSLREAAVTSTVWVVVGLAFGVGIWMFFGAQRGAEYFAGYLIEKSLSVDNIFVFALAFSYFAVPPKYQHRVLFWGVVGALVFRAIFIAAGAALLENFHWMIYVFGAFLVITGVKMAKHRNDHTDLSRNPIVAFARRRLPLTEAYHGQKFFIRQAGKLVATPLLLVLIAIETADIIFAIDSIPAIFAVTSEPFIVFTSNAFAILGLRALFFLLAGMMGRFRYLKVGLAGVLVFVGGKMLLTDIYKVPIWWSLATIGAILLTTIAVSLLRPAPTTAASGEEEVADVEARRTPVGA